jgi:carboxylesterase
MLQFENAFRDEIHRPFLWEGDGRGAVLLVHGFPGTPSEVRAPAEYFHAAGWTVHAPLLPGFGSEINSLAQKTADDWQRAVKAAYKTLHQNHKTVLLLGNSMGGALCLQLAAECQPDALILTAPFWKIEHVLWWALPVLKLVIPRFKPFRLFKPDFASTEVRRGIQNFLPDANLDDPKMRTAILDFEIPVTMLDQIRVVGERGQQAAPRITCPTLVIQGKSDELVLPAVTRRLIQRIGATVDYTEIAGTHELLQTPASWERIQTLIEAFTHSMAQEIQHP